VNTLHLYGNIVNVFEGKIVPSVLTQENAGVKPSLRFGLGVSCFRDDLSNIGDAVYFNGRFLIRSTDEGRQRDPLKRKIKEGRAPDYRTVYSLGITKHPLEMRQTTFFQDESCPTGFSVESLISRIIGPKRSPKSPPRSYGFLALLDYENIHSTSLAVPPIYGENIIPLMRRYARPSDPLAERSGVVMGFVRDRCVPSDTEESRMLGKRLFFDNPKDLEDSRESESAREGEFRGPHWISHTHGVRLPTGESPLPAEPETFRRMATDESFRRSIIDRALCRNEYEDCGHVIPKSTLRRYFAVAFPIEAIESFKPR
jgi:hypothetical protein